MWLCNRIKGHFFFRDCARFRYLKEKIQNLSPFYLFSFFCNFLVVVCSILRVHNLLRQIWVAQKKLLSERLILMCRKVSYFQIKVISFIFCKSWFQVLIYWLTYKIRKNKKKIKFWKYPDVRRSNINLIIQKLFDTLTLSLLEPLNFI